ncbi:MAG: archaemetzincin family Zn-dependent metalloprotease [Methanomicrobiales archaeon]|nr:archaemetzincin family Zn-dependent metalloprotease [Methanomicrobiales archaeon]
MRLKILWDSGALSGLELPAGRAIETILGIPVDVEENGLLLSGYDPRRAQYDAQKILHRIQLYKKRHALSEPVLVVTQRDLFVKGADFVFGLAREQTGVAVVSTARMRNEFYQRENDDDLLLSRISTEGAHEAGHLLGLSHCTDTQCIMFPPEMLDQLDGKKKGFCPVCKDALQGIHRPPIIDSVS